MVVIDDPLYKYMEETRGSIMTLDLNVLDKKRGIENSWSILSRGYRLCSTGAVALLICH